MFDRNLMRLPGMGALLGALSVLAVLQAAAIVGQAYALSGAVSALWSGVPLADAAPSIGAFFACFAVLHLLRFGQETMLDVQSRKHAEALRAALLERVFDERELLALRAGSAQVANVATDGIDEVQAYLRIIPPKAIAMVAIAAPILICLFAIDWVSGLICAVMFPVIIFFMVLLGRQARERSERQYASYTRLTNRFMDTLRGLGVIQAFDATEREADSVFRHSEALRKATVRTLTTATLSSAVLDLCATFGVAAVAMMLAFRLLDGSLALSTALFALVLAPEYFSPIRAFASDYHASLDGRNALEAVLKLTEPAQALRAGGEAASALPVERARDGADSPAASSLTPLPVGACQVELAQATYRYPGTDSGIRAVSFKARGPQKVAIIGESGSGKSTLASLIAGLIEPTEGAVAACPVRYIPQNPYIFRATLAENMCFYNPCASRGQVEAAVSAVGLERLVRELPNGLDTLVGDGARGLSGGEAHRVALARVLLDGEARALVFDEPTAHLDIETELELKGPMLALMEGKLVFLATHRLHWLDDMDRVIRLRDGRVESDEVRP